MSQDVSLISEPHFEWADITRACILGRGKDGRVWWGLCDEDGDELGDLVGSDVGIVESGLLAEGEDGFVVISFNDGFSLKNQILSGG